MLSRFSRVPPFATPWTIARQAPLSMGFSRQENWRGLPCLPPGYLPSRPRDQTSSLPSPALAGGFFTTSAAHAARIQQITSMGELPQETSALDAGLYFHFVRGHQDALSPVPGWGGHVAIVPSYSPKGCKPTPKVTHGLEAGLCFLLVLRRGPARGSL